MKLVISKMTLTVISESFPDKLFVNFSEDDGFLKHNFYISFK